MSKLHSINPTSTTLAIMETAGLFPTTDQFNGMESLVLGYLLENEHAIDCLIRFFGVSCDEIGAMLANSGTGDRGINLDSPGAPEQIVSGLKRSARYLWMDIEDIRAER